MDTIVISDARDNANNLAILDKEDSSSQLNMNFNDVHNFKSSFNNAFQVVKPKNKKKKKCKLASNHISITSHISKMRGGMSVSNVYGY